MKNVLVTGGAGFVGRHLVNRLFDLDCNVTIVDDLSTGWPPMRWVDVPEPAGFSFLQMDLRDFCRANPSCHYDTIFHCAAVVGGRLTIDGDPLRVATDLAIDADFYNWIARSRQQPERIVYFSSSAAYPVALQSRDRAVRLSETFIDFDKPRIGMPDMTYGWAKLTGELLAQHAVKKHGLNAVCYRPFSGYGEDQDESYPFPAILRRVLNRENPLMVWGSGNQQRDFIHIEDAVSAVLATMHKLAPGDVLNLGSGTGTSFKELATMMAALCGRHIEVRNDLSKPEGVFSRVCDPWKLNQWYKPQISLSEGIKKAFEYLDRTRKAS